MFFRNLVIHQRRIFVTLVVSAILTAFAVPVSASDTPRYEPAPDWVDQKPANDYLTQRKAEYPIFTVLDRQAKIERSVLWTYTDLAMKAETPQLLNVLGNVTLQWNPAKGDLIVHRLQILRGTQTIDVLATGNKLEVMRRETRLQAQQLDGELTAVMPVEGLRLGDIVRVVSSVTRTDAAIGDNHAIIDPLLATPASVGYGRIKTVWPKGADIKWDVLGKGASPRVTESKDGRFTELTIDMPLPEQPDAAPMAPSRFTTVPMLLVSTFADWQTVSRTVAKLYKIEGHIVSGSPLALEADRIAAATENPRARAALALRFVQDEIRYLANGLGDGNYVPQTPSKTWELRYGDCKAKTLLLLALLDRLKIEAVPVTVSVRGADQVTKFIPSLAAFDHIIVRAIVDGEVLWLDGTSTGSRLANIGAVPPFRHGLPATLEGEGLQEIAFRVAPEATVEMEQTIDARAGIAFPAPYKLIMTLRGPSVDFLKAAKQSGNAKAYNEAVDEIVMGSLGEANVVRRKVEPSEDGSSVKIIAEGLQTIRWPSEGGIRRYAVENIIDSYEATVDRARPEWRDIPVSVSYGDYRKRKVTILLPERQGPNFVLEGDQVNRETLTGYVFDRQLELANNTAIINEYSHPAAWELSFELFAKEKGRLAQIRATPVRLVAPADYPNAAVERREAMASNRLKPIIEMYGAAVAADLENTNELRNRALFYYGVGDKKSAAADVGRMLKIEASADDHSWRASLLSEIDPKEAMAEAEKALELDPEQAGAVLTLTELLNDAGRTEEALAVLDRPGAIGMGEVLLAIAKSDILDKAGRADEAIALLNTVNTKQPGNPKLLNMRCWVRGRNNRDLELALKDCTRSLELTDEPHAVLDSRGLVYFQMARYEEALADYEAALTISSAIPSALYMRGIIKRRQNPKDSTSGADIDLALNVSPKVGAEFAKIGIKP